MLWCGAKGKQVALTKLFSNHLLSITTAKSGKIRVGSYITLIAKYLKAVIDDHKFTYNIPFQTSDRLNLDSLARHFMVWKFIMGKNIYWHEVNK